MTSKLKEYLKTVQELQSICNYSTIRFVIDVFRHQTEFRALIEYLEDGIRKNKYFDFFEGDDENSKNQIKEIKTIIREQKLK